MIHENPSMSEETYIFWLYWSDRRESPEQCADRLARMIDGLADCDPLFAQWNEMLVDDDDVQTPFCKVPADRQELTTIFLTHRSYYDVPPDKPWPEMGYLVAMQNGKQRSQITGVTIVAGSYVGRARANSIHMKIGDPRIRTGCPWHGSELRDVMRVLIEAWRPDEAVLSALNYEAPPPRNDMGKQLLPSAGWLTYLTREQLLKVTPPNGVRVDYLADGGAILTLCDEPFRCDNPQHIALAAALDAAMRPIQAFPT
jgi:hypothetical protein